MSRDGMSKELEPYNSKALTFCHRGGIRDTVVVRKHVSSREVEIPMASNARTGSAQVLLVGLSFRSAPVTMLEQVSIADADMQKMQLALMESDALSEALVLSTCNRFELYTVANAFHDGLDHVVETISRFSAVPAEELEPHLYVHYSNSAAEHMLNVASGLDSMVMGEQQIIGQLRSAYQDANEIGTVGRTLHDLTQRALRTGKRVHSETAIDTAGPRWFPSRWTKPWAFAPRRCAGSDGQTCVGDWRRCDGIPSFNPPREARCRAHHRR